MHRSYLALGSNLNCPARQLGTAVMMISSINGISIVRTSGFHTNPALIHPSRPGELQPDFCNAVLLIETGLEPSALLEACQLIESQMGRNRSDKPWEARIIDIDILLYDNLVINEENLTIPHPEIKNRKFVLGPLFEINPDLILPDGTALKDLIASG